MKAQHSPLDVTIVSFGISSLCQWRSLEKIQSIHNEISVLVVFGENVKFQCLSESSWILPLCRKIVLPVCTEKGPPWACRPVLDKQEKREDPLVNSPFLYLGWWDLSSGSEVSSAIEHSAKSFVSKSKSFPRTSVCIRSGLDGRGVHKYVRRVRSRNLVTSQRIIVSTET